MAKLICSCGAEIFNGHHCANGHLQYRDVLPGAYYPEDHYVTTQEKLAPDFGKYLTFATLREANVLRLPEFKNRWGHPAHSEPDGSDWSPAQWLQAIVGELGEYANKRKKFERGDISDVEFYNEARKELADVVTYVDILAFRLGIDLGAAVREKFNEISRRAGSTVFIGKSMVYRMVTDGAHDPKSA